MSEEGFQGKATAVFQYMPPGKSVICATVDGKPARREVFVDASTAERLQRDLDEKLAAAKAGRKAAPCGLFDHRDGAACLHPKRFTWDDARGVLLEAEWTQAGKAAVEGKDYLYWSPTFRRVKATGRVMGLQDGVEVGSLVNNPAFESIEPVAAAAADDGGALDGECEDVNCCGRETVNAAHCNQYQHVPGCPHASGGKGGNGSATVEKLKKEIEDIEQDFKSKRREYAQMANDEAYGYLPWDDDERAQFKANKQKAEAAAYEAGEKLRKAKKRLADEYRKLGETAKADRLEYADNVKSSNQKDTMKENNTSNEPGEEVFASKRVCAALVDALEAVSAARSACERCTEQDDDDDEEAAKKHKAELERLKAALDEEQDEDKKAVIRKRIDEMEASNPYGCNQYGHSFKSYHRGFSSNANIAKKKQAKKNAVSKLNEIARKRK